MTTPILQRTRWNIVFLAVGAGVFGAFQNGKIPAALPALGHDLGLSLVEAGLAVSLLYGIASLIALVAGALADLWGARRFIVAGLLIAAAASAAGGFAADPVALLAARLVEGLGAMAIFVAGPAMIMRAVAPGDQRIAFGIWGGYMPGGTSCMLLATPFVVAAIGWRGLWWVNTALLAGFAAIFWLATRSGSGPGAGASGAVGENRFARLKGDLAAVLRTPGAWLLALCFATYTAHYLCVASFLPTLLVAGGLSVVTAGTATAFTVAGNVAGNLAGGWLLQRGVGRGLLVAIAAATMAATGLGIYATDFGAVWKLVLFGTFSTVGGLLPASVFAGIAVHAPSPAQIGTANGLVLQWGNVGQLAGPPLFAALASAAGWGAAAWLAFALGLAGVALGWAIARHERRRAA
ncbi:MAG: MFS transporter [Rhodospirillaceae bacterium]|nr:MFS transporter [Rhodospirillaceae bacterium]